jgi:DNA-binding Xre family transcriptional regulator
MYINYSRLWQLLAEKELTKSDLMELTGLSSRVIAKLAKNETVTTDTIAKICEALSCGVEDMMECASESTLSLYHYSRSFGECAEEIEGIRTVRFVRDGVSYVLYMTKKTANKATRICCEEDGTIRWEQHHMMGGPCTPYVVSEVLIKPMRQAGETVLVVIKGKPGIITGLDEGMWVSARNGRLHGPRDVFVMSEAAFKVFEPKQEA